MPGLLDSSNAGLLGGLRQIASGGYGGMQMSPQGGYLAGLQQMANMPTEEDRREYEAVRARGYTGTFEDFMAEKRKRQQMPRQGGY